MKKIFLSLAFILSISLLLAQSPVLGTYPATTVNTAGGNIVVTPSSTPVNATGITATATANFKGLLQVNPATGVVTVTNAAPAGNYTITVKAFNGTATTVTSFGLTVNNSLCGNIGPVASVPIAGNTFAMAVGDFNGDGNQDLAAPVSYGTGGPVSIRFGNGTGGFSGTNNIAVGDSPSDITIGDFNGDGNQDFATCNGTSQNVSVRLGNGTGGFTNAADIPLSYGLFAIVSGDFNNDGRADLAVVMSNNNVVAIRLGDGTGNFSGTGQFAVGNAPNGIVLADFNNDGNTDFATANTNYGSSLSVRLGDGTGSFSVGMDAPYASGTQAIATADFNKDGNMDLVTTNGNTYVLSVYYGNGAGGFGTAMNLTANPNLRYVKTADFNGDGNIDLLAGYNTTYITISYGNGTGGFTNPTVTNTTGAVLGLATGDFNKDGKTDVVTSCNYCYNTPSLLVFISSSNEINVLGNNTTIPDGTTTTSPANHTEFNNVSAITRTYTIQNTGAANLSISNILMRGGDSAMFTVGGITLPATVAPNAATTFTLSFIPTSSGSKTSTVNILNDDCDEAVYDFAVQGTGTAPELGDYTSITISATGGNARQIPFSPPLNTTSITATTTPNFKGVLQVNAQSGALTITNARPAGVYIVRIRGYFSNAVNTKTITLTVGSPACSQGNFSGTGTIANVAPGNYAPAVAAGDFNNDGKTDFAVADNNGGALLIRLGNGNGTFSAASTVSVDVTPVAIAVADVNNDGNQDLLSVSKNAYTVSVRLGNGNGSFTAAATVSVGVIPQNIAVADFNGDGKPDFAVTNYNTSTVYIKTGDGTGNFPGSSTFSISSGPRSIVTTDCNNDGIADLLIGSAGGNTVSVKLGDGAGGFTGTTTVGTGLYPDGLVAGDFNNDGNADFAGVNSDNTTGFVRLGDGRGNFTTAAALSLTGSAKALIIGDFNNDGKQDLGGIMYGNTALILFAGNGAGGFTSYNTIYAAANIEGIAVADCNNDGIEDLLFSGVNTMTLRSGGANQIVVQGNNTTITPGDATPDVADSTYFGNVPGGNLFTRRFTIKNGGLVPLTVTSIRLSGADSLLFGISGITLPATVAAGGSATFNVTFTTDVTGLKSTVVKLTTDNCDYGSYTFSVAANVTLPPALGNYSSVVVQAGGNTTLQPDAAPAGTYLALTATAPPAFKGILSVNPSTGVVRITNAYPAGTYSIRVGVPPVAKTFTLTVASPGCSPGVFASTSTVTVGSTPVSVAVADFNNDGIQDLVVSNLDYANVSIRLGTGGGLFNQTNTISVGQSPRGIAIADFNGDGNPDFAVANNTSGVNTVSIRLGNGTGAFTANEVDAGTFPWGIATGDFNNDGKMDFAVTRGSSAVVSVRLGTGAGSFYNAADIPVQNGAGSIVTGDFNEDGKTDLAVSNTNDNTVSIRLGNGDGSFSGTLNVAIGMAPQNLVTADFNNDGHPDIAAANMSTNIINIRLGDGTGFFTGVNTAVMGQNPLGLAAADFNGDGNADLIATNNITTGATVRMGSGSGTFSGGGTFSVGSYPAFVAVADFNGDGKQDFVTANTNSSTASVRLNLDKEINVLGNNNTIVSGSSTADTLHHTLFGTVNTGNIFTRTYTLQNKGTDTLKISDIVLAGTDSISFTKGGITLPTNILAGASRTFTITFAPADGGLKTARVKVLNNDCDEGVYDFAIKGRAVCTTVSASNVWLGITADWNSASNWSLGFVPNGCGVAVVNTGVPFMPQINTNANCYSLTLNNGATFTVTGSGNLNITGP